MTHIKRIFLKYTRNFLISTVAISATANCSFANIDIAYSKNNSNIPVHAPATHKGQVDFLDANISNFNTVGVKESTENLSDFVKKLIKFAEYIFESAESDAIKKTKVKAVLSNSLDIDGIAKFVLGKHIRTLSPAQQQEFKNEFQEYLLGFYGNIMKLYQGQKGELTKIGFDKKQGLYTAIVDIKDVSNPSKPSFPIRYIICYKGGKFLVRDAIAKGMSFANTLKQQFNAILTESGFEGLKSFLRDSDKEVSHKIK